MAIIKTRKGKYVIKSKNTQNKTKVLSGGSFLGFGKSKTAKKVIKSKKNSREQYKETIGQHPEMKQYLDTFENQYTPKVLQDLYSIKKKEMKTKYPTLKKEDIMKIMYDQYFNESVGNKWKFHYANNIKNPNNVNYKREKLSLIPPLTPPSPLILQPNEKRSRGPLPTIPNGIRINTRNITQPRQTEADLDRARKNLILLQRIIQSNPTNRYHKPKDAQAQKEYYKSRAQRVLDMRQNDAKKKGSQNNLSNLTGEKFQIEPAKINEEINRLIKDKTTPNFEDKSNLYYNILSILKNKDTLKKASETQDYRHLIDNLKLFKRTYTLPDYVNSREIPVSPTKPSLPENSNNNQKKEYETSMKDYKTELEKYKKDHTNYIESITKQKNKGKEIIDTVISNLMSKEVNTQLQHLLPANQGQYVNLQANQGQYVNLPRQSIISDDAYVNQSQYVNLPSQSIISDGAYVNQGQYVNFPRQSIISDGVYVNLPKANLINPETNKPVNWISPLNKRVAPKALQGLEALQAGRPYENWVPGRQTITKKNRVGFNTRYFSTNNRYKMHPPTNTGSILKSSNYKPNYKYKIMKGHEYNTNGNLLKNNGTRETNPLREALTKYTI